MNTPSALPPITGAGLVVLTGPWLRAALTAVQLAERRRGLDGLPPMADYGRLRSALSSALAATGHENAAAEPESVEWVSTREAARTLGCSERQARRIAARVGRRVGGRWLIPADALQREEN